MPFDDERPFTSKLLPRVDASHAKMPKIASGEGFLQKQHDPPQASREIFQAKTC